MIEPNLLLVFTGIDTVFFLNENSKNYKTNIEYALQESDKNGLKKELINKYFGSSLKEINYTGRIPIYFENPDDFL